MMRFRFVLTGLLALVLALGSSGVQAQGQTSTEGEIRQMLEERNQEIKTILQGDTDYTDDQRQRLKELINGIVDFRAMGKIALGPHWSKLSAEQKDEFVSVFREVVRAQSMSDLGVYNSKVTFDQITVQDDSAFVRTLTEYEGTTTPVEYDMRRKDGMWVAQDIIVDEVSTAEGYARSFQTLVRRRGFEALMTTLRKKRDEVTASSAE